MGNSWFHFFDVTNRLSMTNVDALKRNQLIFLFVKPRTLFLKILKRWSLIVKVITKYYFSFVTEYAFEIPDSHFWKCKIVLISSLTKLAIHGKIWTIWFSILHICHKKVLFIYCFVDTNLSVLFINFLILCPFEQK